MYARQKMIIWQFSHIVQTVLVMAKWIIADCMTSSWLWVNLCCYPCKHEREILSRRFKCPPCLCRIPSRWKSVATIFDKLWQDGVPSTRCFCLLPAVSNWISRVLGETTIPVIFAGTVGMWVILSIEVLKDWHLIQCSQAVSAANSTIAKIDAAVDPSKGCKGP